MTPPINQPIRKKAAAASEECAEPWPAFPPLEKDPLWLCILSLIEVIETQGRKPQKKRLRKLLKKINRDLQT